MLSYALRRLLIAVPTLLVIILLSFILIRLAPGGPFDSDVVLEAQVLENLNRAYNLDRPLWEQFFIYLSNIVRGDLGPSMIYKDFSVNELLASGLPVSASLGLKSIILSILVGSFLGIIAALKQNKAADYGVMTVAMSGIAIPNFVLAPILALIFGIYLNMLPVSGWGGLKHQVLPVIAVSLPQIAIIARLMRASMIEALRSNFVRAARLNGIPERQIVIYHALPAAMLPVVSYIGPAIASVATGSLIVEHVFDLPGIGRYFAQGAINRDYPVVMGVVVIYAAAILVLNLLVDLIYGLLDPKVRQK